MKIKELIQKLKPVPKKYFQYTMYCRKCDCLFKRYDIQYNKCPMCGNYMEVFDAVPIGKDEYDYRA